MRFATLALVAACSGKPQPGPPTPHALPGFSVALPEGTVFEDHSSVYGEGTYSIGAKGSWIVALEWAPGELAPDDRARYVEAWKLETATQLAISAPNIATETFAGTNHGPARVSFLACGARHIAIESIDHTDVDKLHRAVLASFVCKPDPAQEHIGARITLAAPEGWLRIGNRPEQLMLERDGGQRTVLGLYYSKPPDQATFDKLVAGYHGIVGPGDPHPVSAPQIRGWLRTLTCGKDDHVVAMYIEAGSGAADRTTIDGIRCLRPDEPDPSWPAAPAELQGSGSR